MVVAKHWCFGRRDERGGQSILMTTEDESPFGIPCNRAVIVASKDSKSVDIYPKYVIQ